MIITPAIYATPKTNNHNKRPNTNTKKSFAEILATAMASKTTQQKGV